MNRINLKLILKFLACTLILSYAVDKLVYLGIDSISKKVMSGENIGKLNHFLGQKDSIDYVVFGNSRASHHIDVQFFPSKSYNAGFNGKRLSFISTLIEMLPKEKHQFIILSLDPKSIFDQTYEGRDILDLSTKYRKHDIIRNRIQQSNFYNPLQDFFWTIDYNNKLIGILKNYLKPKYDHTDYNGYDPLFLNSRQEKIRNRLLDTTSEPCLGVIENPISFKFLKQIKLFCTTNNKTLIAITTPTYFDNCPEDNQKLQQLTLELSIKHIDYTNFFSLNNDKKYWKDETHLSHIGAEIFSKHLGETLLTELQTTK